jgi:hypothetical protein
MDESQATSDGRRYLNLQEITEVVSNAYGIPQEQVLGPEKSRLPA